MISRSNRPPNILIIMSDEHGAQFSDVYGHRLIDTPAMGRLAAEGVTFDSAYCNVPLCAPSRVCFMTGQDNHNNKGWDNASPMREDAVTWPYLLRSRGYDTALCGKMHLVGLDQLRGFSRQLARDLHAELRHPIRRWKDGLPRATHPWPGVLETGSGIPGHEGGKADSPPDLRNRQTVPTGAGHTVEIAVDDQAERAALAYLKDPARHRQPWALCVGLIAPHFPFVVPEPFFSMYWPEKADLPYLPEGHLESLPQAARNLRDAFGFWGHGEDHVRRARAAYYGLISYLDAKIGRLLDALESNDLAQSTVVIHTSDHGEMLGEHGLWRKMSFYEESARIPLQVRWPGVAAGARRFAPSVSLNDVTATILDIAGVGADEQKTLWRVDGNSLASVLQGKEKGWVDQAFAEHNAHGTDRPRAMLRRANWKLCLTWDRPNDTELYDLASDPHEMNNLAGSEEHDEVQRQLTRLIEERWDGERIFEEVTRSQDERVLIRDVDGGQIF
jgi:choline-sulfatase